MAKLGWCWRPMVGVLMKAQLVKLLCVGLALALTAGSEEEKLPGWKGETFHPAETFAHVPGAAVAKDLRENPDYHMQTTHPWVEVISWQPRTFVHHNFLSPEECDHIVNKSKPLMKRSTVVGEGGKSVLDTIRTSYGTFLRRKQDPVITRVEERLADWTQLNIAHQEDMQILRYAHGQKYGAHYDTLQDNETGLRVCTVLLYLSDVEEGGETAFPQGSKWVDPGMEERFGPFSDCAKGHVAIKPKKGTAMLFYSMKPNADMDEAAMHTGCPVIQGVKWTATKWIHTKPFHPEWLDAHEYTEETPDPEQCQDLHERCADWAESGECDANPEYMKGDNFALGSCRKSCKMCEDCDDNDKACRQRNREAAGYLPLLD